MRLFWQVFGGNSRVTQNWSTNSSQRMAFLKKVYAVSFIFYFSLQILFLIVRKLITWAKCETLAILAKFPRKTDKYFPFAKLNLRENFFTHLRHFLTFVLFVFILRITWHLGKVSKKVKTERVRILIDAQCSCFGSPPAQRPPCLFPKTTETLFL